MWSRIGSQLGLLDVVPNWVQVGVLDGSVNRVLRETSGYESYREAAAELLPRILAPDIARFSHTGTAFGDTGMNPGGDGDSDGRQ